MSKIYSNVPTPNDYELGDWDFRMHRLGICKGCEFGIIGEGENEEPYRMICGNCGCLAYAKSSIKDETPGVACPLDKWPHWNEWKNEDI